MPRHLAICLAALLWLPSERTAGERTAGERTAGEDLTVTLTC